MNHQGLLWNLHCAATVVLREDLNFKSAVIRSKRSSCRLIVCTVYIPSKNRREGKQERKGRKTHGPHTSYSRTTTTTNKVRFNTVNINLYFNTFKLKSVYWQKISYNKICSSLKFSFLFLLMTIANWLGNQQLARYMFQR